MIFTEKWGPLVLRGIAAIIFGVLAFACPGITLRAPVVLFAACALVDGAFAIAAALNKTNRSGNWGAMLLRGILGIIAAIAAVTWPAITALVLLYLVAGWALATGILEIAPAVRLRKAITREWLLIVSGILFILFGVALVAFPGQGSLVVLSLIGTYYALVFGALLIGVGLELRSHGHHQDLEAERRAA
jgi:uncharacterized membrane protein HdeD (DUF308 family)